MHPTSALAAVSTAIQQSQGNSFSIKKTGNKTTLAHATSQAHKVGVSCNCKKGCGTRRCRCHKNDLKCSIYCHNTDYLKPPTERAEVSPMTRESWEVLDCSEDDEGDQRASETRAPVSIGVQDRQIQTHSPRKAQTSKQLFHPGGMKCWERECGRE